MKTVIAILFSFFAFAAYADSNQELNSNEIEALKDAEIMLFEGQGYQIVQSLTASGNYYCKKKNNKWVRCSKVTGQCFGEPMDKKFQCENALPTGGASNTAVDSDKYCVKNKSNDWVTCSKSTGQCFGHPMDTKAQCEKAWTNPAPAKVANSDFYCTSKNYKFQRCSYSTGQCFGALFDKMAQCQNTL